MIEIEITTKAQDFLFDLIKNQDSPGIKIGVEQGGTPNGETTIAYWDESDKPEDFELQEGFLFPVYKHLKSINYLKDAVVDYTSDNFGGTLTIKAPNSKVQKLDEHASLEDRINFQLYTEINPSLASHGGQVSLEEVLNGEIAVLRFGGGCQGCSAVDLTLKAGIEVQLRKAIPEIKEIMDATDHTYRENAYYK